MRSCEVEVYPNSLIVPYSLAISLNSSILSSLRADPRKYSHFTNTYGSISVLYWWASRTIQDSANAKGPRVGTLDSSFFLLDSLRTWNRNVSAEQHQRVVTTTGCFGSLTISGVSASYLFYTCAFSQSFFHDSDKLFLALLWISTLSIFQRSCWS